MIHKQETLLPEASAEAGFVMNIRKNRAGSKAQVMWASLRTAIMAVTPIFVFTISITFFYLHT